MWHVDERGSEFRDSKEALRHLQKRAESAIAEGDLQGHDVRRIRVRLRDDAGHVLFEGTMEDAARLHIDGRTYVEKRFPR